jgi:hypothetical protein
MEFYEWKAMARTKFHPRVPDPGASGRVARVLNVDAMMKEVNASRGSSTFQPTRI